MANSIASVPINWQDTRVTVIQVDPIPEGKVEAKSDLIVKLKKEAPDFLGALMQVELPKSPDRFNIPVITTTEKAYILKSNRSALEEFIADKCFDAPGYMIKLSDFHNQLVSWLDPGEAGEWSIRKIGKALPMQYPKGRNPTDAQFYIGNLSFEEPTEKRKPYVLLGNKLKVNTKGAL